MLKELWNTSLWDAGVNTKNWIKSMQIRTELNRCFLINKVYKEKRVINWENDTPRYKQDTPNIPTVQILPYGFIAKVDAKYFSYDDFEKIKGKVQTTFNAQQVTIANLGRYIEYTVINKAIDNLDYKHIETSPYQLLIGHDNIGRNLIVDMDITPHMGVVGTSKMGKTKCIETALYNLKGANITLLNCMSKDFLTIKAKRINGNDEILTFLQSTLANREYREKPHYIVIDEYNVLSNVKGIDKIIQDLLSQARHFNVFLIVLMQLGNKEDCKFKNLFNCRLVFRTIEKSTIHAFLGVTPPDDKTLQKREFYLLHDELVKGKTFTV